MIEYDGISGLTKGLMKAAYGETGNENDSEHRHVADKWVTGKNSWLIEINLNYETVYRPYRFGCERL
jgi:hypothetical protein